MYTFHLFSNDPDIVRVKAGEVVFREGDAGGVMFVLASGRAEVRVGQRVVEEVASGNIVGELGLVSPGPRSATVVAQTDCEFVRVDEDRFKFLVQQTPYFALQVMRVMAERLRAADKLIAPPDTD